MKKILMFSLLSLIVILVGCNKKEDEFKYEVKLFNEWYTNYDDVKYNEFIYLHGSKVVKTYEEYLEVVFIPHFMKDDYPLTYDEDFFIKNSLILINIYDERAEKFNVGVTKNENDFDIQVNQINGIMRNAVGYRHHWTIAVEVETKKIDNVNYQNLITNDYYEFYTYFIDNLLSNLKPGTFVFEDYSSWKSYIDEILTQNESNIKDKNYNFVYDLKSLLDIVNQKTFNDKVVIVNNSHSISGITNYSPIDVFTKFDQSSYEERKIYFKMAEVYHEISHQDPATVLSIFIIDKVEESFTPVFTFFRDYYRD